ncbi:hypothetical protein DFAR_200019 [Desulfarculales bacterium]
MAILRFSNTRVYMMAERFSMRKIKEVLRLKHEAGCGNRDITKSCGIAVSRYLRRATRAGLSVLVPPHQFG